MFSIMWMENSFHLRFFLEIYTKNALVKFYLINKTGSPITPSRITRSYLDVKRCFFQQHKII